MTLDISSFAKAITLLEEGLLRYESDITDTQIRDGLIQRFEFTYELAHKMLKRYLQFASATPDEYDRMAFADVIRSANEQGLLLGDVTSWRTYRDRRSRTSHTYEEEAALKVVTVVPSFLAEVRFLRDQLRTRLR